MQGRSPDGQLRVDSREPQTAHPLVNNPFPVISGLGWETSDGSLSQAAAECYSWPLQRTRLLWPAAHAVWNPDTGTDLQPQRGSASTLDFGWEQGAVVRSYPAL